MGDSQKEILEMESVFPAVNMAASLLRNKILLAILVNLILSSIDHNVSCCLADAFKETTTSVMKTNSLTDASRGDRKMEKKDSKTKSEFTGINFNHPDFKSMQDLSKYSKKQSSMRFKVNEEAELRTGVSTQLVHEAETLSQMMKDIAENELQSKFMQVSTCALLLTLI